MDNDKFCILPWIHLTVLPTGKVHTCCMNTHLPALGDVRQESLEALWNHPEQKALRQRMLAGEASEACASCYAVEKSGGDSLRRFLNGEFANQQKLTEKTASDGSLPDVQHLFWELRYSNLCNLKCRTCTPEFSSAWYEDGKLLGYEPKQKLLTLEDTRAWEHYEKHLATVEEIAFLGGEPLLEKQHYALLEKLISLGRTDVRLRYNTNFTRTELEGRSIFALWKHFPKIFVFASIDGYGEKGEYIRKGMRWETLLRNKEALDRECSHVRFLVFCTLSIFNVFHLTDFFRTLRSSAFQNAEFNVNYLHEPRHLSPQILPIAVRLKLQAQFDAFAQEYLIPQGENAHILQIFRAVRDFLTLQNLESEIPKFLSVTKRLDTSRGEDFRQTFPELAEIFPATAAEL